MGFLIFSDLDGTLLNHHNYGWEGARPALDELNRRSIPLILTTSKTRAELLPIRAELDNRWPFITENGGAVYFPHDCWPQPVEGAMPGRRHQQLIFGLRYEQIRAIFQQLRRRFPIRGFGDMTIDEIATLTGLEPGAASLSRQREFSEPFLLEEPTLLDSLVLSAGEHDCSVTRGGRFFHLLSRHQDKGVAVQAVIKAYRAHWGNCTSIGLGDSKNDLPMLDRVDIPVLIARPDDRHEPYRADRLVRSRYPGSRGWGETVLKIIGHASAEI